MAMTAQQVADWMRAQGVDDNVIADEAAYVADTYADPDEHPIDVLQASLGSYLQRTRSGRDYPTTEPDPAVSVTIDGRTYTAPERVPSHVEARLQAFGFANTEQGRGYIEGALARGEILSPQQIDLAEGLGIAVPATHRPGYIAPMPLPLPATTIAPMPLPLPATTPRPPTPTPLVVSSVVNLKSPTVTLDPPVAPALPGASVTLATTDRLSLAPAVVRPQPPTPAIVPPSGVGATSIGALFSSSEWLALGIGLVGLVLMTSKD
jgi:hypothetical protein